MNNCRAILSCLLLLFSLAGCTEKSVDIEILQDACKRFKIKSPGYNLLEDPCSGGVKIRSQIQFSFNRTADCLHKVQNYPVFYTSNNTVINPSSFSSEVFRDQINIVDDRASYVFEAEFPDIATAVQLNHIILDFNTQNELGVQSNQLQIRINTSCSTIDSSSYNVNSNSVGIPNNQSIFTIRLWDNAAEDGDIVSVYLNGQWLIENHSLLKAGTNFNFSTSLLNPGANDLVVFALNEGSSGPNTVSIAINGQEIPNFKPGLLTGEAVRINFN